ncbi:MAG TPA: beta-L-arabinofuranosidase domain-containing protein, partial [Gemmatimonadaceae bacterium]|nr:beta-L-arabinofuranosidase domain-containing protein [Gemmatimonadaceae bacterium]
RLLHMFRVTAGLPSSAEPLGGWEAPDNELRGHFAGGHYLSACALLGASLGDAAVTDRGKHMVAELAKCQRAHGDGYLSAFPEEFFDRLREGQRVWAPFYTLHKIMAGLLDTYTYSGSTQALDVLEGMAGWVGRWTAPLSEEQMQHVLEVEYGGMNEVLYNLSAVAKSGGDSYRALGHRFDHRSFFDPLARGRDELAGLHANTHIPQVIGAAWRYELTGETRYRDIAHYFWREVTSKRDFCTGGTSNDEGWHTLGTLSKQLSGYTHECCCTYNMLKLTRHVFEWTADPACADYYERALFNGILGTEHPSDGQKLYYVSMESGFWKLFGTPLHAFWCCTGTGAESFSKFGDSIYFHDDRGVFVNLFIPSEVTWAERGIRLAQETRFPEEDSTTLTVHCAKPVRMPLRIRVPYWVAQGGRVSLNGRALARRAVAGSYFVLDRTWHDGDRVQVTMPMRLHVWPMPDDPSIQAIMYGPVVLAGRLGTEGLTPATLRAAPTKPRTVPQYLTKPVAAPALVSSSADPSAWIHAVPGSPLEFRTTGQRQDITLVPFSRIMDERYAIYWKVT